MSQTPLNIQIRYPLGSLSVLWLAFFGYSFILGYGILNHELWGDELHSWNIARASGSLTELFRNIRYEGHPPLWYLLLYGISRFTYDPVSMQVLHFVIVCTVIFILIFRAPFPMVFKLVIPAGYYFAYEYAVLSRNYSIGVLLALLLCLVFTAEDKTGRKWYYVLLFLLSNTHFLGLILAFAFQLTLLHELLGKESAKKLMIIHAGLGTLVLLPAFIFIYPPFSSGLSLEFWKSIWSKDQLYIILQAPLKALAPIPAWWELHLWNSNALVLARKLFDPLKYVVPLASLGLLVSVFYILSSSKKALIFFSSNLVITLLFALIFPISSARYVGFIFVAFIIAWWIARHELYFNRSKTGLLMVLLSLQVAGGLVMLAKDWSLPFSHYNSVSSLNAKIPEGSAVLTDYWCLNYITATTGKPVYCLGFNTEIQNLKWNRELSEIRNSPHLYSKGLEFYLDLKKAEAVYLFTSFSQNELSLRDTRLFEKFKIDSVFERTGAIEKSSSIYLYRIIKRKPLKMLN